jgi:IclR family mhp operon transcriptional activator
MPATPRSRSTARPAAPAARTPLPRPILRRGKTDPAIRSYPPVEAVRRALQLLEQVNLLGVARIAELHRITRVPKPTIIRTLETLMEDGYVDRDPFSGGYRVTSRVQNLSRGFDGTPLILEAARAWTVRLTQEIGWPAGIGFLDGQQMSVKFTTAAISPWPWPVSSLNMRLDLLGSAMGLCYLAFCSDRERDGLLAAYDGERPSLTNEQLATALRTIRRNGFARRIAQSGARGTQLVALPILNDGNAVACLCAGFYTSAVPQTKLKDVLVKPLRDTIQHIEQDIRNLKSLTFKRPEQ